MTRAAPLLRSLAVASAIPLVVVGARFALDALALSRADALAVDALASATSLALLAVAAALLGHAPLAQRLGLAAGRLSRGRIALGALGVVALSHASEGVLNWMGAKSAGLARFDDALGGLPLGRIGFPLLALALGSACGEELFFRGFLQRGLERAAGRVVAIALASAAFGAAHGDLVHGCAAALLGAYLGVLASAAGSIRPAIAAHAANNALALLEVAADLRIPDGPIATPISVSAGIALACGALALALRAPRRASVLQSRAGSAE